MLIRDGTEDLVLGALLLVLGVALVDVVGGAAVGLVDGLVPFGTSSVHRRVRAGNAGAVRLGLLLEALAAALLVVRALRLRPSLVLGLVLGLARLVGLLLRNLGGLAGGAGVALVVGDPEGGASGVSRLFSGYAVPQPLTRRSSGHPSGSS